MLSPAAIAKVYPHNIEAGAKGFVGRGQHVRRRGRALHAVPHHQGRMLEAILLPATVSQDLAFGFDLEKPRFIPRVLARANASGPQMHRDCLRVALFEDAMRNERPGFEIAIYLLKQSRNGGFIVRH
jgi:hypothetical protein